MRAGEGVGPRACCGRAFVDVLADHEVSLSGLAALDAACREVWITNEEADHLLDAYEAEAADPTTPDRDDLAVLRGWSGLPGEEDAVAAQLEAMPMQRFHAAVARLVERGLALTSFHGTIRGITPAGRAKLSTRPCDRPGREGCQ